MVHDTYVYKSVCNFAHLSELLFKVLLIIVANFVKRETNLLMLEISFDFADSGSHEYVEIL